MGRFLVTMDCPSMTMDDLQKGEALWNEALSDYTDLKWLREYDNLSKGHVVSIFEAPSADRIRQFFDHFGRKIEESGLFPEMSESDYTLDILPIEVEYEGGKITYQTELAEV